MGRTRALATIRRDIAAGRRRSAVARLRVLAAAHPGDQWVYRQLTQLHREAGQPAEAGRWGFLTDDVTPTELAAFQREHPRPVDRLRLIGPAREAMDLGPEARRRLWRLASEATDESVTPHSVTVDIRPGALARARVAAQSRHAARARRARRKGPRKRPAPETVRSVLLLGLLVLFGTAGALGAFGLVLAMFGVNHWDTPIRSIVDALGDALGDLLSG